MQTGTAKWDVAGLGGPRVKAGAAGGPDLPPYNYPRFDAAEIRCVE
ncbi:hypothetical protein GCM10023161_09010 [Mycobacterium paraffinicum]|uniref:Uncharacterized protein n=1 Tax=Mycobacterium paraffinicum TaxID=53378 RepID=A0ABP8RCU5_9MYCO